MALALITFIIFLPSTAFAYIDPGSGSMALQIAIAFIFSGIFWFKSAWRKLMSLFSRRDETQTESEAASCDEESTHKISE
ncbi:hypothetical protein BVY02_01720 [bacterium J17]|nr:hypothetical protein BVY02_01720 [bacterium J17]